MYKLTATLLVVIFAIGCGSSVKENKGEVNDKKVELQKLKEEQTTLNQKIRQLEEDLAKTDTSASNTSNAKLVVVAPVTPHKFVHFIDLQGKVDAENLAYVTPRGVGGQVKAVYVNQGDPVKRGQLLIKLDDAITRQQVEQAKIELNLAETLYERRKNLWEKQIGTEVELLQAKNRVDNLKKQVSLLEEQGDMSNVYAEIAGVADMVTIKPGEFFSPQTAAQRGIRLVNTNNLKVTANVPENYLHKVDKGAPIEISLPDINKKVNSRISVKGTTIDPNSRSFYIEAKIPSSKDFQPNQLALVKIQDYVAENAITIPISTLQNDEQGKFVMVAVNENGRLVAKKRRVEVGELYGSDIEVKSGLQPGDTLITEGFQGLYDGQQVMTNDNK
jgi:RND family efflux transporter MFP subunit